MYCPTCGSEYRIGVHHCTDCDVPLVHEPSPEAPHDLGSPADEVVVFRSSVAGETDMVAGALAEAGIEATVRRGIAGGLQLTLLEGGFTPGQELVLAVPRVAEAAAREVIDSIRPETGIDPSLPELAPADRLDPVETPRAAKTVASALLLLFLVPLALGALSILATLVLVPFR